MVLTGRQLIKGIGRERSISLQVSCQPVDSLLGSAWHVSPLGCQIRSRHLAGAKTLFATPTISLECLGLSPSFAPDFSFLPLHTWEATGNGSGSWVPATSVGSPAQEGQPSLLWTSRTLDGSSPILCLTNKLCNGSWLSSLLQRPLNFAVLLHYCSEEAAALCLE